MFTPINSLKLQYTLDPVWILDLYPTNKFNISNLSQLELTIPHFKKYNTRAKYEEVCNSQLFFEIILNRLEFYTPELRTAVVLETDLEEYKFLEGKKVYLKNKNVGKNRHEFNPETGTFNVFIPSLDSIFGYKDQNGIVKALNDSVVCKIPLGEPFEEITLESQKNLSDQQFFYQVQFYNSLRFGSCLDLFNIPLEVLDISKDLGEVKYKVGDKIIHAIDYIYRSNLAEIYRDKDEIMLFVLDKSVVGKKETD
jgi:hypothetical protein